MASFINAYDWKNHPLGEISTWPKSLRSFVSLMLVSRFPMFMASGDGEYSLYNDGYIPILADKHPAAIGARYGDAWGELSTELRVIVDRAKNDETSYFEDLLVSINKNGKHDQSYFTFSTSGLRGDAGEIEGFFTVCLDTTASFLTKQKRVEENERLRAMFEQAPGFMTLLRGPTHIFEVANEAHRVLVGKSRDILGRTVDDAIPEAAEQGFIALLDEVHKTGKPFVGRDIRALVSRVPGSAPVETYVDFVHQPIFDDQEQVTGILVQGNDVTQAYFARQALIIADRQKDEFLAMLAHELRNPLAPISSAASILMTTKVDEVQVKETSQIISRQVKHMTSLVNDLLDVSRVTRGLIQLEKAPVDFRRVVADAVEQINPLIQARGHHLILHLPPEIAMVSGDNKRLVQVVANMLGNAAKYTYEGGTISLKTETQPDTVCLTIEDNGVGMAPELVEHVFDLFTQAERTSDRSSGGLGLGLALVKSLVELHGGKVTCASAGRGEGTRFTVSLPRLMHTDQRIERRRNNRDEIKVGKILKILIVDDNVDAAEMLAVFLKGAGHEVLVEYQSQRGLHRARLESPDVCLLDIGLPEMDGNELAKCLRNQPETTNSILIAVTGYGQEEDRQATRAAGFDHHMVKPIDLARLSAALATAGHGS